MSLNIRFGPGVRREIGIDLAEMKVQRAMVPAFVSSGSNDPCPFKDPARFCHQFPESDYANNVGEALVDIPDHPGRSGVGPGKNDPAAHDSDIHDDAGEPID